MLAVKSGFLRTNNIGFLCLCFQVPKHNHIYALLYKLTGTEKLTRENVRQLLRRLLDRSDTNIIIIQSLKRQDFIGSLLLALVIE